MTEAGQLIDKGIAEARSGNRLLARLYLERAVDGPDVSPALWLWLAWVAESPEKASEYLHRLDGVEGYAELARGALPWIQLMCEEGSPLMTLSTPVKEPAVAPNGPPEHRVDCPHCAAVLYVRARALGKTRTCPACETSIAIPAEAPRVATAPPLGAFDYVPGTVAQSSGRTRIATLATHLNGNGDPNGSVILGPADLAAFEPPAPPPAVPGRPVLVVDDNPSVRSVAARILTRRGYQVETAASGFEALSFVARSLPGLILLDSQMPGMDGFELCQRLRSHPRTRDLPIIMLSSKDAFFDRVQGRLAGCSHYVTKPCDANVLCEAVDKHYDATTPVTT